MLLGIAIVVVLLLVLGQGDPVAGAGELVDQASDLLTSITRGPKVTTSTFDDTSNQIVELPADLAAAAGTDLDTYSLARMIASENGNDSNLIQASIAWAAANYAERQWKTITDVLTVGGHYGSQRDGRYASTKLDPHQGHVDIAEAVLDGTIADPTGGATNFDAPRAESDPGKVSNNRLASGLVPAPIDGVDATYMRFWKPG